MKRSTTQRRHGRKKGRISKTRKMRGGLKSYDELMEEREELYKKYPENEYDINELLGEKYEYLKKIYNGPTQNHEYGLIDPNIIHDVMKFRKEEEEYKEKLKSAPQKQKYGRSRSPSPTQAEMDRFFESLGDKNPNKKQKPGSSRSSSSRSRSNSRGSRSR